MIITVVLISYGGNSYQGDIGGGGRGRGAGVQPKSKYEDERGIFDGDI